MRSYSYKLLASVSRLRVLSICAQTKHTTHTHIHTATKPLCIHNDDDDDDNDDRRMLLFCFYRNGHRRYRRRLYNNATIAKYKMLVACEKCQLS